MAKIKIDEDAVLYFITLILQFDTNGVKSYDIYQETPKGCVNEFVAINLALEGVKEKFGDKATVMARTCSRITPKVFITNPNAN